MSASQQIVNDAQHAAVALPGSEAPELALEGAPEVAPAFFSGGIGTWEWVIILVIMLLLFGRRLPDVMRNLGSSAREFRKGLEDGKKGIDPDAAPAGSVSNDQQPAATASTPTDAPATEPTPDRA